MTTNSNSVAVKLVSDGTFLLDGGPMFGPVPKILWERDAKPDRKNRVRLGLNSLLIKTPIRTFSSMPELATKSLKSLEKSTATLHLNCSGTYVTRA
jgi:hypothetical protein